MTIFNRSPKKDKLRISSAGTDPVLKFICAPSLATFVCAFPEYFYVGLSDTFPQDFMPDATDDQLDRIQEELIRIHEERFNFPEEPSLHFEHPQTTKQENTISNAMVTRPENSCAREICAAFNGSVARREKSPQRREP
jgi:hypothetical protein